MVVVVVDIEHELGPIHGPRGSQQHTLKGLTIVASETLNHGSFDS